MRWRGRAVFSWINLRQCFLRLGCVLAMLWFVYWTCAYVIKTPTSENSALPPSPALSAASEAVLVALAVLGLWWIVSALRSD